ncbi:glucosamine-6-phosphate deaminase [Trichoderma velutinum]
MSRKLIIRDTHEAVSDYVAEYIIKRIIHFAPTKDKPFVFGVPTGSSPIGVYQRLVQAYESGRISFENVVTFNMDEYVDLPQEHPESFHTFMWKHFYSHVDIPESQIHIPDGNAADLEFECKEYERKIESYGGVELFLGGIGIDGHLAFNVPGSSITSRTRVQTLTFDPVLAKSPHFQDADVAMPTKAITVGVGTMLVAREVMIIATGSHKARAVEMCIEHGVNHMWTVSTLQLHTCSTIVVDNQATEELKVKTVSHFKLMES